MTDDLLRKLEEYHRTLEASYKLAEQTVKNERMNPLLEDQAVAYSSALRIFEGLFSEELPEVKDKFKQREY